MGAGIPKARCQQGWFLLSLLSLARSVLAFSLCPHKVVSLWESTPGVSPSPCKDTTNHTGWGLGAMASSKALSPNMITLGVRASTHEFGRIGEGIQFNPSQQGTITKGILNSFFRMSMTQVGVLPCMPSRDVIHSQLLYIYNIKIWYDIHRYWFLFIYFKLEYVCNGEERGLKKG